MKRCPRPRHSEGGGIGYEGIEHSVGIEFDSWKNEQDPDRSSIGIDIDGNVTSKVTKSTLDSDLGDLDDGAVWYAWVDYNGQTDQLEVRVARRDARPAAPFLSHTVDLLSELGSDAQGRSKPAYIGFTSATGMATADHDILSWSFRNDYQPIATAAGPIAAATPAPPVRPSGPPPRSNTWGDVHISTPDGLRYDFQAAGEFLLTRSSDGSAVVQTRQETWPQNPKVTVNTAAAMNVEGDRVGFYAMPSGRLVVNGVEVQRPTFPLTLPRGGVISQAGTSARPDYTIYWPNGFEARVIVFPGSHLDVGTAKAVGMTAEGLVGNQDQNPANDMAIRGGGTIAPPAKTEDLYGRFGDSWRIRADESLFDYAAGTSAATFSRPGSPGQPFTAANLSAADRNAAQQRCQRGGVADPAILQDCVLDVAATGDQTFVESAAETARAVAASGVSFVEAVAAADAGALRLGEGEQTCSPNGTYCFKMAADGNVVLFAPRENNRFVWGTFNQLRVPLGNGPQHLEMVGGDLRLVRNGQTIWSTGTGATPGARLYVTDGGDVEIRGSNGTVVWSALRAVAGPVTKAGSVLRGGEGLAPNEQLCSPNGSHCLVFQNEGNLVVYRPADSGFVWGLNTTASDFRSNTRISMQEDGNFVAYTANSTPTWATMTQGRQGNRLELRDSGELVVLSAGGDVLWSSSR